MFSGALWLRMASPVKTSVLVKWPWTARLGQPRAVGVTRTQPGESIWASS